MTTVSGKRSESFNPRPGAIPGATLPRRRGHLLRHVSIRAPELSPGRPARSLFRVSISLFQSAPRSYPRGDLRVLLPAPSPWLFQSAPRSYPRGDTRESRTGTTSTSFNPRPGAIPGATRRHPGNPQGAQVSIRAPELSPGRPLARMAHAPASEFQSAPRSYPRGDQTPASGTATLFCFNPRPGAIPGATWNAPPRPPAPARFQSAPRSYPRGDGRNTRSFLPYWLFQSAPRSYPRGDPKEVVHHCRTLCFNPRPGAIPGATEGSTWRLRIV